MITAIEAKQLYETPPLTLEEIEKQIRESAKGRDFTCFDVQRVPQEIRSVLTEAGYTVDQSSTSLIVSW